MGGGEGGVEESFSYGGLSSWFKVQRFMVQGAKVQGAWFKVHGSWFMVHGARCDRACTII